MRTMYVDVSPSRMLLTRMLGRVTRGAFFGPFAPLHLTKWPDPPLPHASWARVHNRMCGICGSDLHQLYLDAGLDVAPLALPAHHRIYLGHEMVGTIVEVGPDVSHVHVGDRVVRWGRGDDCLARGKAVLCPACRRGHRVLCEHASEPRPYEPIGGGFGDSFIFPASGLIPVPPELCDEQAIFTEPAAVAIHAVWRSPPDPGARVLVIGCGTIGYLLMQVLRVVQPRCEITAIAQYRWQAHLAHTFGATHTILEGEDLYARVAEITGAQLYQGRMGNKMLMGGFDVTFDVVGIPATLHNALRWTRARGTVVLVGVYLHRMCLDLTPLWHQEVNLIGAVGHDIITWQEKHISTFELAMQWMLDGRLETDTLLTHTFPLDAYSQAFRVAAEKDRYRSIKVAFDRF